MIHNCPHFEYSVSYTMPPYLFTLITVVPPSFSVDSVLQHKLLWTWIITTCYAWWINMDLSELLKSMYNIPRMKIKTYAHSTDSTYVMAIHIILSTDFNTDTKCDLKTLEVLSNIPSIWSIDQCSRVATLGNEHTDLHQSNLNKIKISLTCKLNLTKIKN